jgi:hypothetical protein
VAQEITGLEVTALIEDPEHASVRQIVAEVLGSQAPGAQADASAAAAGSTAITVQHVASPWISPAPITVKMRLFCLPYAGGISENVYARSGVPHTVAITFAACSILQLHCTTAPAHTSKEEVKVEGVVAMLCRWATMLPAAIQVCPIELPGRGRRRGEPPVNDVAVLADQLADALPLQVTHAELLC